MIPLGVSIDSYTTGRVPEILIIVFVGTAVSVL